MIHKATCCQVHKEYDTSYSKEYKKKLQKGHSHSFTIPKVDFVSRYEDY